MDQVHEKEAEYCTAWPPASDGKTHFWVKQMHYAIMKHITSKILITIWNVLEFLVAQLKCECALTDSLLVLKATPDVPGNAIQSQVMTNKYEQ